MIEVLDSDGFMAFATLHYDNPSCCGEDEFLEDLDRIKYIKRLLRKYNKQGILRERLLVNHLIVLTNVFGVGPAVRMLFFRIDEEHHSDLKTLLLVMKFLPDSIPEVDIGAIPVNSKMKAELRNL